MLNSEHRMREGISDCRQLIDSATADAYNREWAGDLEPCASCGGQLSPELEFFADAEVTLDDNDWGLLCPVCLTYNGNEMIWGRGQLYQYKPERKAWLMVAGFPPRHLWETNLQCNQSDNVPQPVPSDNLPEDLLTTPS